MENIFLIGPMGSGKTTLGRRIAPRLGLEFVDIDEELEKRCGVGVALIFEIEGEAGFRERERNLLAEVAGRRGQLIATGGGSVLDEHNREVIRANGHAVWMNTSVDQQIRRLERDKRRPLLAAPDRRQRLTAMAEERNPIYASMADAVFESKNRPLGQMAGALERTIRSFLDNSPTAECRSSN